MIHHLISVFVFYVVLYPINISSPVIQLQSQAYYSQEACEYNKRQAQSAYCLGPNGFVGNEWVTRNCKVTLGFEDCQEINTLVEE